MALPQANKDKIHQAITLLLEGLGEDPHCEQFKDTPKRVAELYSDVMDGQFSTAGKLTTFAEVRFGGAIMVHHVPFYAMCAHHLLMFQGTFGIAYVPSTKVLGLSKLVRIFRQGCKRPTTQEQLTIDAVELFKQSLPDAKGVMCYVSAEHTCMTLRGVKSPGSLTTTVEMDGVFKQEAELRQMFLDECRR